MRNVKYPTEGSSSKEVQHLSEYVNQAFRFCQERPHFAPTSVLTVKLRPYELQGYSFIFIRVSVSPLLDSVKSVG